MHPAPITDTRHKIKTGRITHLRVSETERVEATLAKPNITSGVVAEDALLESLVLEGTDENGNLHNTPLRH